MVVADKLSHSCEITGKTVALYILRFVFYREKGKIKYSEPKGSNHITKFIRF